MPGVSVRMRRESRAVGYLKDGVLQTLVDAHGRNLALHIDAAVEVLALEKVRRVLVLGFGGGAASTLLWRRGVEVVSVDRDPCAGPLARLFFRAPPDLPVIVEDASTYAARTPDGAFDAVLVDFQDSPAPPAAYLDHRFWADAARTTKPAGLLLVNVTDWLYDSPEWTMFRRALATAGLDSVALSEEFESGNRLLVTARGP